MDKIGSKVTGKSEEVYSIRSYFRTTIPILKLLHQNRLFQSWHERISYVRLVISGINKGISTGKWWRKFEFDKSLEGLHPHSIYFISIAIVSPWENSRHIFVVDAHIVRWPIGRLRNYSWMWELTVLSYCNRLQKYLNQTSR